MVLTDLKSGSRLSSTRCEEIERASLQIRLDTAECRSNENPAGDGGDFVFLNRGNYIAPSRGHTCRGLLLPGATQASSRHLVGSPFRQTPLRANFVAESV